MTREEAIKHFEAQAQCNYKPTLDAAKLAITALRAQQVPAKLDRSRWEECAFCDSKIYMKGTQYLRPALAPATNAEHCPQEIWRRCCLQADKSGQEEGGVMDERRHRE